MTRLIRSDLESPKLAEEAKSIVAFAFRNGPLEDIHAGGQCPTCAGQSGVSHITQDQMRDIMQVAVDRVYSFLCMRDFDPKVYEAVVALGSLYTGRWDDPKIVPVHNG